MTELRTHDAYVTDQLDVDAEIEALGISLGELDRQLIIVEEESPEVLAGLWTPEPGLENRIETRVRERLHAREEAWLLIDLVNLGWQTAKAVFDLEIEDGHHDQ